MIDKIALSEFEEAIIDTTNNIATVVLIDVGAVNITNENNISIATLEESLESFTMPINTGVYRLKNTAMSPVRILVFRQFIY